MSASERTVVARPGMPDRIGRYRILERIGRGSMGIVYGARDDVMDRDVAIKVMMADLEDEPETQTRFYREAQAAGALSHPNIIVMYDVGNEAGRCYIVMERLRGHTLLDFLKTAEPSLERKLDLMIQVCEGLAAAHAAGVYHRDIKPGNLFVRADGILKILDFGVARLASSSTTATGLVIGTPDYMSPEQAKGKSIDGRSDIFSAGGVFYFMLTGRRPFPGSDLPAVFHRIESEDPLPLRDSEAPPALAHIVMKALAKAPAARYQTCAELAGDLLQCRRQYKAETRRLAERTGARFQDLQTLIGMLRETEARFGLTLTDPAAGVIDQIGLEVPQIKDRGAEAFTMVSFERAGIERISTAIESECTRLTRARALMEEARSAIERGTRALEAGDVAQALHAFEHAVQAVPSFDEARVALERTREEMRRQQQRTDQARTLTTEAGAAASEANWPVVLGLCDTALKLDPDNPELNALRGRAEQAIRQAEREQAEAARQLANRTARALKKGRLSEAEDAVRQLATVRSDWPDLPRLESEVANARAASEAERALAQRTAEAIARAREECAEGRRHEALAMLGAFLQVEPQAGGVRAELTRLQVEVDRQDAVDRDIGEAEEALSSGDVQSAIEHAEQALRLDPRNEHAARIVSSARTRRRQAQESDARNARVAACVRSARQYVERGAYGKALKEAQAAVSTDPTNAEAAALMAEIISCETEARLAREREQALEQRLKAARPALAAARDAMTIGDYARACWAAENALLLVPESTEARDLRDQARQALDAAQARKSDETVDVWPTGSASSSGVSTDDTVDFAIESTGAGVAAASAVSAGLSAVGASSSGAAVGVALAGSSAASHAAANAAVNAAVSAAAVASLGADSGPRLNTSSRAGRWTTGFLRRLGSFRR